MLPAVIQHNPDRPRLLAPPDWRYQEARAFVSEARRGQNPTVPSDPLVQLVVRALRCGVQKDGGATNKLMHKCWPLVAETLDLGLIQRRSAIAATIEVCLIKGWSHAEARKAGCPVGSEVYKLYEAIFFDLGQMRTVAAWLQDFLIEPERYSGNSTLLRARLLACYGQGDAGISAAVTGVATSDEEETMKKLSKTERQKRLFDYVTKYTRMEPEVYASVMETALKTMNDHDFQERMKDREDAGSSSLEELAAGLEEGVRAYSQSELEKFHADGIDFVNQYTKALTGKNDNGKDIGK